MQDAFALFRVLGVAAGLSLAPLPLHADTCPDPGQWRQPGGERLESVALLAELAERDVVLLGEQHDRMDHHRWQLHTLAGLHALRPDMAIGLEMLPREAQPALDAWVAGELDEAAFLAASDWYDAWGFDPELYLPILHFARLNRVPLKALNVTPELRERLVEAGWQAVPEAERFGITPPAEAPPDYRERLAEAHAQHADSGDGASVERFIAAQLVWDRAMAAGLAEAADEAELVVGLVGQGHLRFGHGVPHQLDDLGLGEHATLLPWPAADAACEPPPAGVAQAVFGMAELDGPQAAPPQLGILLAAAERGVAVEDVVAGSVAEQAGLAQGDLILRAAGEVLTRPTDLIRLVRRQPPGTLLPLEIRRDDERREVLARFPPREQAGH
ncbi:ChaN family lipoprotein [Billgrantia lactosivorans]|uniref:ChaN family lipoprotein n=1 Tax=Billgrantia lactosivorans TaxID=2185141 RepID=UPI000DACB1D6|nr:ChaN family lipoprotein [Halomonas lactosivorans]